MLYPINYSILNLCIEALKNDTMAIQFEDYRRPPGWFSPSQGNFYKKLVSSIRNGNILEIGTMYGRSLSYIWQICRNNNNSIYSVDIVRQPLFILYLETWKNNTIRTIDKSSVDASNDFQDNYFDLIMIDANHSYESVKQDIVSWMPKLNNKGYMIGHDYDWGSVAKSVNDNLQNKIFVYEDIWITKKTFTAIL
jgi:predicted O-methyltransferase YrrM